MFRLFRRKSGGGDDPGPMPLPDPADRLYVIGDIHGRSDLLETMFRRIAADFAFRVADGRKPRVIVLGDIIDRGDNSREVVERLKSAEGPGPLGELIILKGNHEAALLEFLSNPAQGSEWLRFGGMQTLASYGVAIPPGTPDARALHGMADRLRAALGDHLPFLQALPLAFSSGDVLCVHAGIDPENPTARDEATVLWGRARFPETGPVAGLRVVHGHYDAADPVITDGRICVDTGAYYSGRLTAVRLDDETGIITTGR